MRGRETQRGYGFMPIVKEAARKNGHSESIDELRANVLSSVGIVATVRLTIGAKL